MLTFAVCTYNRCARLPALLRAMRSQQCALPYEVLVVDNNSSDATQTMLARLAQDPGAPVRVVFEPAQGIVQARNRALAEALDRDYLVFIDDDELPRAGLLTAAVAALRDEDAECVGGAVRVDFAGLQRPPWLEDSLLGFLAEVDHGDTPFWVTTRATPVWTANVGYRMSLFRDDPTLRFDARYNRIGSGIGGGSDAVMFRRLLERGTRMRYRPDMIVDHSVEPWRLHRRYFLRLHYRAGVRTARFESQDYHGSICGIAPFMIRQALVQAGRGLRAACLGRRDYVRTCMNAAFALGTLRGRVQRWRDGSTGAAAPVG